MSEVVGDTPGNVNECECKIYFYRDKIEKNVNQGQIGGQLNGENLVNGTINSKITCIAVFKMCNKCGFAEPIISRLQSLRSISKP